MDLEKVHDLIGVTGCIGSGKSTVARYLAELADAHYVNADDVCRELMDPGKAGWQSFKERFGNRFFDTLGRLDRPKLREAIFSDPALRNQVDALLHPLALQQVMDHARQIRLSDPDARIVVEVPLLFEAGWQDYFVQVIVVCADNTVCCQRLMERDNVTFEAAEAALTSQWSMERKLELADHVIDNSGPWPEVAEKVRKLKKILWPTNT